MQLTNEQLEAIETFGGLNFTPLKISMMLSLDHDEFLSDFNMSDADPGYKEGQIRYHYDLGHYRLNTTIDKANARRAEEGNMTSLQQFKKDSRYREIQNAKRRTIYQEEKANLEGLHKMIADGDTSKIPPVVLEFVEQIEYIRILFLRMNSKQFITSAVKKRWPRLDHKQITLLYNECLTYFYPGDEIPVGTWTTIYAERIDNLGSLCVEMDLPEIALKCWKEAAAVRGVGKNDKNVIPPELLDRRKIYYTMDIEKLGIPKCNKYELAAFIDNLDLTQKEKAKFRRESMIEDTPFEISTDDEQDKL